MTVIILHIPKKYSKIAENNLDFIWKVQYTDYFIELTTEEKREISEILEDTYFIRKWIVIPSGGWDYAIKSYTEEDVLVDSFVYYQDYISLDNKQYYYFNFDANSYTDFMEKLMKKRNIK